MGLKAELEQVRVRAQELLKLSQIRELTQAELKEADQLGERGAILKAALDRSEASQRQLRRIENLGGPIEPYEDLSLTGPAHKTRWHHGQPHPWRPIIEAKAGTGTGLKDWTSGAVSVPMLFGPGVIPIDRPPNSVLELLDYQPLEGTDRFSVLVQTVRDLNAEVVPPGEEKPESTLEFALQEGVAVTIATYATPIPKQFLADVENLDRWIAEELQFGIEKKLAQEVLTGDGQGSNLLGIIPQVGPAITGGDAIALVRRAIADLTDLGVAPTAILMNSQDSASIDLLTDLGGAYFGGGPFQSGPNTLWGLQRIATPAMPAGECVVGDFREARVVMRDQGQVSWSDSHADTYIRNLVTALAELRAGFMLIKPYAFKLVSTEQIGPEPETRSPRASAPASTTTSPKPRP